MVSLIASSLRPEITNESSTVPTFHDSSINGSMEVTDITTDEDWYATVVIFVIGLVGLPGNMIVIAIYARNMATSTRVYVFALAVADTVVCMCAICVKVLSTTYGVIVFLTYMSMQTVAIAFSILLLAFVSAERLMAVWRPHKFSLSPLRAKVALALLLVPAGATSAVLIVARVKGYKLWLQVLPLVITVTSFAVMIVCYSLVAIILLIKLRASNRKVGIASKTQVPSCSTVPNVTIGTAMADVATSQKSTASIIKKSSTKQANTYKGLSLLFIVTIVFILCWMPLWLSGAGLYIPMYVIRMQYLHSAVNPFIYSAVSRMFRDDARQFYLQMRSRLPACHP